MIYSFSNTRFDKALLVPYIVIFRQIYYCPANGLKVNHGRAFFIILELYNDVIILSLIFLIVNISQKN